MGSRALRKHVATESAWIVERYLEAGLVIFGKTNTPEWGNHCTTEPSLFGPTVNPWSSSIAGWTSLANVTGWAAISLPLGVTSQGLPIGVRLIPDEVVLLQLAAQLEVAAPWLHRWPSM